MQLGMVGLGRMGSNMVKRLMKGGHTCVVYDRSPEAVAALVKEGATGCKSLDELVAALEGPRAVWVMVPAGAPTEETIAALASKLSKGDTIIDGGNTYFKDDVRRGKTLAEKGLAYVDVGTSGGIWGFERGYCLMVGATKASFDQLTPLFRTLAPGKGTIAPSEGRKGTSTVDEGLLHCGPVGSGHFVKMIHNGIEYGVMQAYAEGFDILRNAGSDVLPPEHRFDLKLEDIAEVWRRGSVISSWLLDLTSMALAEDPKLEGFEGFVPDSGEGRWTVQAAIEEEVPATVLTEALFTRFRSRREHTFAEKVLSAMRAKFGGHKEKPTS